MARLHRGRTRREAERKAGSSPLMFWLRLVVVFVLVGLLVAQVIRVLDQSYWRQSELDAAVYRFGQTAMLVNSEWLRAGRHGPVRIQLGGNGVQRSIQVPVNEQGWPLAQRSDDYDSAIEPSDMDANGCARLWAVLSQAPELLQYGLEARWDTKDGLCIYQFDGNDVFNYRLQNGHLKTI